MKSFGAIRDICLFSFSRGEQRRGWCVPILHSGNTNAFTLFLSMQAYCRPIPATSTPNCSTLPSSARAHLVVPWMQVSMVQSRSLTVQLEQSTISPLDTFFLLSFDRLHKHLKNSILCR